VFTVPADDYVVDDAGLVATLTTFRDLANEMADAAAADAAAKTMAQNQATVQTDFPDKDIAEALESVDALVTHLNSYLNYYRAVIFKIMPWSDAFANLLSLYSPLVAHQVVGFSDEDVALPLNVDLDPRVKRLFDQLVTNNTDLMSMQDTLSVVLPTPGVHLESRLGQCTACEDYVEQIRKLDLESKRVDIELKHQQLEQQKSETQRFRDRLNTNDYSDPLTRPTTLRIEGVQAPQTPAPAAPNS
jgi:hypothetical protein